MNERYKFEKNRRKKSLRILAVLLSTCILFTTCPDIAETLFVFAAGTEEETDAYYVSGFKKLPEEVAKQNVPVGTDIEELLLPDSLDAYVIASGGESINDAPEEETDAQDVQQGETNAQDAQQGETDAQDAQQGTGNQGTQQEDTAADSGDTMLQPENTESGEDADSDKQGDIPESEEIITENAADTVTVEMPEYYAENVITIETLENTDEANQEEPAETEKIQKAVTISGVTWRSEPEYDGNTAGTYIFTALLPDGYETAEGVNPPQITVTVQNSSDEIIQALIDRIAALPDIEEYIATEPDVADSEEAYVEWEEMLYEYAKEALAIQDEYAEMTGEQQAQISEEELAKLAAWVEIAEALVGNTMVMAAADSGHGSHSGWTKLTSSMTTLAAGNYYLAGDITCSSALIISGTVTICLNGHTIQGNVSSGFIRVHNNSVLNIYDCKGGGKIYCSGINNPIQLSSGGTLNLYGGTVEAAQRTAIPVGTGSGDTSGGCTVNIYGGTVKGGTQAIMINPKMTGSSVNVYGGEVSASNFGIVANNGQVALSGGKVAATASGGLGIQALSGVSVTLSGTPSVSGQKAAIHIESASLSDNGYTGSSIKIEIPDTLFVMGTVIVKGGGSNADRYSLLKSEWGLVKGGSSGQDLVLHKPPTHNYGSPVWKWTGNTSANAEFSCTSAGCSYKEVVASSITSSITTQPTCKNTGVRTYTATVSFNGSTYSDTKTETIPVKPFTVKFDANGGTGSMSDQSFTYGVAQSVSANTFTRKGYRFSGWNTKAAGGGSAFTNQASLQDYAPGSGETVTFYAQWERENYTITYDLKGGTVSGNPAGYTVESNDITLKNPTRTGYTFAGWSGTGLSGSSNKTVTIKKGSTGNRTYTANWTARTYSVTLNGNGGSGGTALNSYTYAVGADLPADWKKTGYTFAGWYDNQSFNGAAVDKIAANATGNKTFYAKWTIVPYTVTFDYQGATSGNVTGNITVTYGSAYSTLPTPQKTGYTFKGWYTQTGGGGSKITAQTSVEIADNHKLYAFWKDETPPDSPALQTGVTLPVDWTQAQTTIPLRLHDSASVAELWVSIDGASYTKVNGFRGGSGNIDYAYTVSEGNHTYRFKAKDTAGNESSESAAYKVMLDTTKPVIGTLKYDNKASDLWQYIIGKKSMIIHVPVTETGSGATEISFCMTPEDMNGNPDSSNARIKTSDIRNGEAQITFSGDFKGTITITCTDAAGNKSDSVTIGTSGSGGVIVEDTAPKITSDVNESIYHEAAPAVSVSVKDDMGSIVTAGIASITYKVGNKAEKTVNIDMSSLREEISFTIPASEIPTGVTALQITAVDNAGNQASKQFSVKVKGPEKRPEAAIDYDAKKLKDLVPGAAYIIDGDTYTADSEGCILINDEWFGSEISIVKKGNGTESLDSEAQKTNIPSIPAEQVITGVDAATFGGTGKLTGLTAGAAYEISTDGGNTWKSSKTANASGEITGLAPGSYVVRIKAGESNFAGKNSNETIVRAFRPIVTFMVDGAEYQKLFVDYGTDLSPIPVVPSKADAGDILYIGEWCSDGQGTLADFTNITENMEVHAVYTKAHKVTLKGGLGYTLTSSSGSVSLVKDGGSFVFTYSLMSGFRQTESFAVRVNGAKVDVTTGRSYRYTISDITEDMTVTVEGIEKIPDISGTGDNSSSDDDSEDNGSNGNNSGNNNSASKPVDNGKPGDNINPEDSVNPIDVNNPGEVSEPGKDGKPGSGNKPGSGSNLADTAKPGTDGDANGKESGADGAELPDNNNVISDGVKPESDKVTATATQHTVENGRIVIAADGIASINDGTDINKSIGEGSKTDSVPNGNDYPNAVGKDNKSIIIPVDSGAVVVTVNNKDKASCTAQAVDAVAVSNAVLSEDEIMRVSNGENIEIRIDVERIDGLVDDVEKTLIEKETRNVESEIPGLTVGMYVDISMYMRAGGGEWNYIHSTSEPVKIIIDVPEELQNLSADFYIVRSHEGECTMLTDMDDAAETITIETERFSTYAIAYQLTEAVKGNKCGLCHICPTFLGICCFIWLAVITVAVTVAIIIFMSNRKKDDRQKSMD